jgi:hypothetical protein
MAVKEIGISFPSGRRLATLYMGEILTFMPILADLLMLEKESVVGDKVRGTSYVSEDHSLITRRLIGFCVCTSPSSVA